MRWRVSRLLWRSDSVQWHETSASTPSSAIPTPRSSPIEAPRSPGVRFHHMFTVAPGNIGEISSVIGDAGSATVTHPRSLTRRAEFPRQIAEFWN